MRRGDWIQTYTGRSFWPFDPRPEEIVLDDIAHSLAMQCRFNGHCRSFYSVAQHCVLVSALVEQREPVQALYALLHDASEAYLSDIPRPVKRHELMAFYLEQEALLQRQIYRRFGLASDGEGAIVKWADDTLLATELRDLMSVPIERLGFLPSPVPELLAPVGPSEAERMFLSVFERLSGRLVAEG